MLARVGTTRLYAEPVTEEPGCLVHLLPESAESLPSEMSLEQAWSSYPGTLIFLPERPPDLETAAERLESSPLLPTPPRTSLAWVVIGAAELKVQRLPLANLLGTEDTVVVAEDTVFTFDTMQLPFGRSTPVLADFASAPAGLTLEYPPAPGRPPADGQGIRLEFSGAMRMVFQAQGLSPDFSAVGSLGGLNAVLRYVVERPEGPKELWYPVFGSSAPVYFHLLVRWDPLESRSEIAFLGDAYLLGPTAITPAGGSGASFDSYLRTIYAETVTLSPRAGAKLVPHRAFDGSAYWEPVGPYALGVKSAGPPPESRLLCGLSGTEFIAFKPLQADGTADVLIFTEGGAAYIPAFPVVGGDGSQDGTLLDGKYKTSWVTLAPVAVALKTPIYYSQPPEAALYQPAAQDSKVLGLFDAPACLFNASKPSFPLAPYGGVQPGALPSSDLSGIEWQILTPSRRAALSGFGDSRGRIGAAQTTTTPQGFLAQVDGTSWDKVTLAKSMTSRSVAHELAFRDLPDPLRDALQSNELFLVATRPGDLGTFDNLVTITDWPFHINVGRKVEPNGLTNVLIFKFCKGTLWDRVKSVDTWSAGAKFNEKPSDVSLWIDAYLQQAKLRAEGNPWYKKIVALADDPQWTGVLSLAVDIDPQNFPADIKGLLGGIDLTRFNAHHFGVDVSFVSTEGGLQMGAKSSLFGLIDYVDKDLPVAQAARRVVMADDPAAQSYDFRVLTLQVAFQNSEIVNFASRIVLTVTELFGEAAAKKGASEAPDVLRNTIELNGSYQDHDGVPYYLFQGTEQADFQMESSKIFSGVRFVKAQFDTLAGSEGDRDVTSRFSLWGWSDFRPLKGLDAFSFGAPAGSGLSFSNLVVWMSFPVDDPPDRVFRFDASACSFDLAQSDARDGSLFKGFPLKLQGFVQSDGATPPSKLGYLPVATGLEDIESLPSGEAWFGVLFGVNLGSMGALAADAGFTAKLLAAWCPGGDVPRVQMLMQLPGTSPGKKLISLQSVLSLYIGQLFLVESTPGRFVLTLKNVGLSLLGVKFPMGGNCDLVVFAGDGADPGQNLGWYGAYYAKTTRVRLEKR